MTFADYLFSWRGIFAVWLVALTLLAVGNEMGKWRAYSACLARDGYAECGGLKP